MKDLIAGIKYDASKVISRAIGPSKEFCMGYMNPGMPDGGGYISTMKLSVGTVDIKGLDVVTESILAYDRCGRSDAYFGQVNMLNTSSAFCGLNGAIWGLDLAVHEDIVSGKAVPMYMQPQVSGKEIPVYNVRPLLDATERLFGKEKQQRFHLCREHILFVPDRMSVRADHCGCGPVSEWLFLRTGMWLPACL